MEEDGTSKTAFFPGRILGFFKFTKGIHLDNEDFDHHSLHVVLQTSIEPLSMKDLESKFIERFLLGADPDVDYSVVPVECIAHPLFVFKNYGGHLNEYFCALPERKWGCYFGNKIVVANNAE